MFLHYTCLSVILSTTWGGEGVSQHTMGQGVCMPACTWEGRCVYYSIYFGNWCLPRGVSAQGVSSWEVSAQGVCVSVWGGGEPPPTEFYKIHSCRTVLQYSIKMFINTLYLCNRQNTRAFWIEQFYKQFYLLVLLALLPFFRQVTIRLLTLSFCLIWMLLYHNNS